MLKRHALVHVHEKGWWKKMRALIPLKGARARFFRAFNGIIPVVRQKFGASSPEEPNVETTWALQPKKKRMSKRHGGLFGRKGPVSAELGRDPVERALESDLPDIFLLKRR